MIELLYIDLFCGAGGTSTGVSAARFGGEQCAKVIACVNHDPNAIASHAANHPDALHFTEDIRTLGLGPLIGHLKECRRQYPEALVVLWASLECTNFSKAKGGQARDADSRTLAEHLFRYIEAINPDYIQIENVEEFMSWGDVDKNGKPLSMDKGRSYTRWVRKVKLFGYRFDHRILNAADYGAYTIRKRFFGIFAKAGLPIVFPEPTHSKEGAKSLFGTTDKWRPIREVLDFDDEGESIFDRKKPLVEATLERIYAGLVKFVAGGKEAFIVKYNSVNKRTGKYIPPSVEDPCPTLTCQNRLALAKVHFLSKQFSGHPGSKNKSVEEPAGTITTIDHHAFVSAYYGNGTNHSIEAPSPTITTKDHLCLVKSCFLMNPQFKSKGGSVDKPCFTLIARMDKMPPYLVSSIPGKVAEISDTDSPMTRKIKEFMAIYGIVDIKMRMLKIPELKKIMGFPEDYVLVGTQAEQKKYIGNAVEVTVARKWCEALCIELFRSRTKQTA